MTMHFYGGVVGHVGQRFCSRCYKQLTDAASMEVGVGPICRKLDNALLAAKIPSDLQKALQAYTSVDVGTLPPETVATFIKIEANLLADDAETRLDWRETVKRIEWMRSFSMPFDTYGNLLHIVEALGYIGVASMWKGEAASGEATCALNGDRLYVSGPMNKSFRIAFKKLLGWKFHPAVQTYGVGPKERPMWSVPSTQIEGFKTCIMSHYPNNKGLGEAIVAAAKYNVAVQEAAAKAAAEKLAQTIALDPVTPPAAPAPAPVAYVKVAENGNLLLKTPYNEGFIFELKQTIPYGSRSWDGMEKVWKVAPQYKEQALTTLTKFFPAADISAVQ